MLSLLRMVCVYLVLQFVMGVIIENVELMEKMQNMKIGQTHLQARIMFMCVKSILAPPPGWC